MFRLQGMRDPIARLQIIGKHTYEHVVMNLRHQQGYYHVQQSRKLDIRLPRE